jgi:HlyD family secretion protein
MSGGQAVVALLAALAALVVPGCDSAKELAFQGWVEAELIFVGPDEAGRIGALEVRQGDQVELRQPLFTLDTELQAADVAMQEAAVKNAKQAYDRAQALLSRQAGTQRTLEEAEAALRTAQATRRRPGWCAARCSVPSPAASSKSITARASWFPPASPSSRCCRRAI